MLYSENKLFFKLGIRIRIYINETDIIVYGNPLIKGE